MNEKEILHFIELSIEYNAIPQEGIKWVKGLLDLYKQEKEKNRELHSRIINEHVYNVYDYELCNKKQKDKIKKALDFINDENNFFEDGENWQNVLKIKEILEGKE